MTDFVLKLTFEEKNDRKGPVPFVNINLTRNAVGSVSDSSAKYFPIYASRQHAAKFSLLHFMLNLGSLLTALKLLRKAPVFVKTSLSQDGFILKPAQKI